MASKKNYTLEPPDGDYEKYISSIQSGEFKSLEALQVDITEEAAHAPSRSGDIAARQPSPGRQPSPSGIFGRNEPEGGGQAPSSPERRQPSAGGMPQTQAPAEQLPDTASSAGGGSVWQEYQRETGQQDSTGQERQPQASRQPPSGGGGRRREPSYGNEPQRQAPPAAKNTYRVPTPFIVRAFGPSLVALGFFFFIFGAMTGMEAFIPIGMFSAFFGAVIAGKARK